VSSLSKRFADSTVVDLEALKGAGLIDKDVVRVKILGDGDLERKLTLKVHAISAGARAKIETAGGSVEIIEDTKAADGGTK